MKKEKISFPEAVLLLADKAGVTVPEDLRKPASPERARYLEICREAVKFYQEYLYSDDGRMARDYLEVRRILPNTVSAFSIGAAPDSYKSLTNHLIECGYSVPEVGSAGLAVVKGSSYYDRFRSRIMIPVTNVQGSVVGFTSRIIPGREGPKYLNSPETLVFKKNRLLYGLDKAIRSQKKGLILVEGNIDVITLFQSGFDNVIATMGTALTDYHAKTIAKTGEEVTICYDNDEAGRRSAFRAAVMLESEGVKSSIVRLPSDVSENGTVLKQDPDDFIKIHGSAAFESLLEKKMSPISLQISDYSLRYDLDSDMGRINFLKEVICLLRGKSPIEREIFAGSAAKMARVSLRAVLEELEREQYL